MAHNRKSSKGRLKEGNETSNNDGEGGGEDGVTTPLEDIPKILFLDDYF